MSPDQRFTVIMFTLATGASMIGWFWHRFVKIQDARWSRVDKLIQDDNDHNVTRSNTTDRIIRLESALSKLSEIVTEMGLQQARHLGYHERVDRSEPGLMG